MNTLSYKRSLLLWLLCCALAGGTFLSYAGASLRAGRGQFMMPLDDVYIHFQYARQLAAGQPYIYNPGQLPTSGATSFLYPYLLAGGYVLGFQGLALGAWAMGLGAIAFALTIRLIYGIALQWELGHRAALLVTLIFALTGAVQWHFMSGMETGLVILVLCLTLYWMGSHSWWVLSSLVLLALLRPEGGVLAGIAAIVLTLQAKGVARRIAPIVLVGAAVGVQPFLNLLLTGSAVASGNAAKSVLGMIPFEAALALERIIEQFLRIWAEIMSGISPREGMYLIPLLTLMALVGWGWLLAQRNRRWMAFVIALWLLVGTAAIATLDTAFWHFKRYQMPFMVVLFPLGAVGLQLTTTQVVQAAKRRPEILRIVYFAAILVVVAGLALALNTSWQFLQHFVLNAGYVYSQPYQMAQWLITHSSADSRVAVHDTGLLRYIGGRTTLDMVGLTTPGAADYWRNGPGAVAELLMRERPDYIAAYGPGHGVGLSYLTETRLYDQPLATFAVQLDDRFNVALAADEQGIYQPDWIAINSEQADQAVQPYGDQSWGELLASVNVADLASERAVNYTWHNQGRLSGFPTEVFDLDYLVCAMSACRVIDGGRRITGEEQFTLDVPTVQPGERNVLVTRLLPMGAGVLHVYANEVLIAARVIPDVPGRWIEVPTLLPNDLDGPVQLRLVPEISNGVYSPYHHWLYRQQIDIRPNQPLYADFPEGRFSLAVNRIDYQAELRRLTMEFAWLNEGASQGDYRLFVHLYGDPNQAPVIQVDQYPGGGALPPGNWLQGTIRDTITLDLSNLPAGNYRVALGLYNPYTGERLMSPSGDDVGRLFIQDVIVP
ncbi:MAG TPA: hypothetical protein PLQ56_24850 [Aggregatilineales bacterium]|nr:hypothetical protein [Aggregatilineales bacterium]